ncbi:MAG: phosphate system positive regulatory protein pho81 [Sclerophora amabilis]|nr:MAG: phosphate system positive regulatory protein pho81 [Sclerophora amabilis]
MWRTSSTVVGLSAGSIGNAKSRRPRRKFGKHLQKRQLDIPEYAASFVNYKALKKLIKKLSATPPLPALNEGGQAVHPGDPRASLQANKVTFFFRLERELEKVNAFYLQKEAELKLRLKTLSDKKKVIQSRSGTTSKTSANFVTLEEGFQQFGNDLNKLQQFVEINATAFSKILKKVRKVGQDFQGRPIRSHIMLQIEANVKQSRTKELYISRAVEVQPCFNRDIISELSDQATTGLLELGAWAEGEKFDFGGRTAERVVSGQLLGTDENDVDSQLLDAVHSGKIASLKDWIGRLRASSEARDRMTRTFLAAINEAPEVSLSVLLESGLVDIHSEDEINERNCLHEAVISGRISVLETGLSRQVAVTRADVYGRIPLHYACIHGREDMLQLLLKADSTTINSMDHDNFTPLIHAIVHHQITCVRLLLSYQARIDPTSESDHIPLNLACQHGSLQIVELLLRQRANILADAEGLFPQHLVARAGQAPELLLMLRDFGVDLNESDKLNQWTPLFHAASEGHVSCLQVLLQNDARVDLLDEKRLPAMYYAAWEGHLECMRLLAMVTNNSAPADAAQILRFPIPTPGLTRQTSGAGLDPDGIPDLSLPPPIIPLRRYGHNFLDDKTFIQLSFEEQGSEAIVFYQDSKYPAARLTVSSKLSDLIPRNLLLPIQDDSRIISFQIDTLDSFAIDFDIFPTFGSKIIAKTVALSNVFRAVTSSSGHCCLPLFDPRLRAIGQISFNFQVIKPFHGVPLEITDFATYWKATSQLDSHPSALITGSSLSGQYVRIFVQLTSDLVPVVYPHWTVHHVGLDIPVSRLTYEQFIAFGSQTGQGDEALTSLNSIPVDNLTDVSYLLANSCASLKDTMAYLPPQINVDLHLLYPTAAQEGMLKLGPTSNLNDFADSILKEVFNHARNLREQLSVSMRSILLSSFNPDVCTAVNWKQPNYPVFLCNDLGAEGTGEIPGKPTLVNSGSNPISVKEAVRIAQSNNFMGLICSSRLLDMVPALIESVKVAGLVLVKDTSDNPTTAIRTEERRAHEPSMKSTLEEGIDGVLQGNGILRFNETIDM